MIERKPNPKDGRGVLIHLTDFGLEKRNDSKNVVLRFNDTVRSRVSQESLDGFFEVMESINEMISEKIIQTNDNTINGQNTD